MFDPSIVCCYLYPITKYGYPPPADDTVQHLEEMHALGFRSVELEGIRRDHLLGIYEQRKVLAVALERLGLSVPYFCVVLPGLSSPEGPIRAQNITLFKMGCEIAALLGARGVLDNAPLPPYHFPDDIPVVRHYDEEIVRSAPLPADLDWKHYWETLTATYREACDIAAGYGLTYNMHPAMGVLAATTDAFLYFYDAVGRENLRFNFDTANQFALQDNLLLSLRRLAGHVDYIHLSDNRGHRVEHLPPGEGAIPWSTFFQTLAVIGFDGHIGIDVGGAESGVGDLDAAYSSAARWLESEWLTRKKRDIT